MLWPKGDQQDVETPRPAFLSLSANCGENLGLGENKGGASQRRFPGMFGAFVLEDKMELSGRDDASGFSNVAGSTFGIEVVMVGIDRKPTNQPTNPCLRRAPNASRTEKHSLVFLKGDQTPIIEKCHHSFC